MIHKPAYFRLFSNMLTISKLPVIDLNDLKKLVNYLAEGPGADEIKGRLWENFLLHFRDHPQKDCDHRTAGTRPDVW